MLPYIFIRNNKCYFWSDSGCFAGSADIDSLFLSDGLGAVEDERAHETPRHLSVSQSFTSPRFSGCHVSNFLKFIRLIYMDMLV